VTLHCSGLATGIGAHHPNGIVALGDKASKIPRYLRTLRDGKKAFEFSD
jgi:hypothetical protein